MSEALDPNSNIEWLENYYQHQTLDDREVNFGGISDSISDSTNFGDHFFPASDTMLTSNVTEDNIFDRDNSRTTNDIPVFSPNDSSAGSNINDMSPKATIAKPVRRRSRASRQTPTTLLNASIENFRTLVQQYTGCHSATSAFKSRKGPVTLKFGSSSSELNDFLAPSLSTALGHGNYYAHQQAQFQEKQLFYHQQYLDQMHRGKQSSFSSGEDLSEYSALSHGGPHVLTVENSGWQ